MRVILLLWVGMVLGCSSEDSSPIFIEQAGVELGVDFENTLLENDSFNIIQYLYFYNGAGVATGDLTGDGLPEVILGGNMRPTALYWNRTTNENGATHIQFEDITHESGLGSLSGWTTGISLGDVNNDGWLDIYISQVSYKNIRGSNKLLVHRGLSNGVPVFEEVTEDWGLTFEGLSTQAVFFDYDLDGDDDLYLLNHSTHQTEHYAEGKVREQLDTGGDKLYRNDGNRFTEVTQEAGIYSSSIGYGLGIAVGDLNVDGYPDLFIGNDFHENDYCYLNNGDGSFREVGRAAFQHSSQFSMGAAIADVNNDGWPDIFSLDMMPQEEEIRLRSVPPDHYDINAFKLGFGYGPQYPRNALQLNRGLDAEGVPFFSEIAQFAALDATDWSWSGLPADFTNNGHKDFLITNGILRRPNDLDYLNYLTNDMVQLRATDLEIAAQMPSGVRSNYFFENRGDLVWEDASDRIQGNEAGVTTGASYADLDGDGDLDVVLNQLNQNASFWINQTNNKNFIKVDPNRVRGLRAVLFAEGAQIGVETYSVNGFMSSHRGPLHLGFGTLRPDSLVLFYPGGFREVRKDLVPGMTYVAGRDEGESPSGKAPMNGSMQIIGRVTELGYQHREDESNEVVTEKIIPWLHSTQGPALAVGDVNSDGLEDIYVGGAAGQAGAILFQNDRGYVLGTSNQLWEEEAYYEDVCAAFFDADADGDLDLVVGSGGNHLPAQSSVYLDRLYLNDGEGRFEKQKIAMPAVLENTSSIVPVDLDGNGKEDLIVSYLGIPQKYGVSSGVRILINQGAGRFLDFTNLIAPKLREIGMITAVKVVDLEGDEYPDLVFAGEWTPLYVLNNDQGKFELSEIPDSRGLWRSLAITDVDGDGDLDILGGNQGMNTFLNSRMPAGMWWGDFDSNQVPEGVLYNFQGGKYWPLPGRDLLIKQMTTYKKEHSTYEAFTQDDVKQYFENGRNYQLDILASGWFEKEEKGYRFRPFPTELQWAPIFAMVQVEWEQPWMLFGGNFYEQSPYIGRSDAGLLEMAAFDRMKKDWEVVSGALRPMVKGQIRKMVVTNQNGVIIARNNQSLLYLAR